jgi:hypothetical protein
MDRTLQQMDTLTDWDHSLSNDSRTHTVRAESSLTAVITEHSVLVELVVAMTSRCLSGDRVMNGCSQNTFRLTAIPDFHFIENLAQSFPNFSAREPLSALKNNHGSSHPCSRQYRVPGSEVS